ncbi:hypothetical protein [Paenibacillus sp. DMB5]|uniref:hypothetical protein n=1 Tax=Paenibacillus sp. DMB5 TaxID=1780103 RepID=UPI00076C5DC3|nr:hypothetical protein [Paenibacillus sp. DMB5]KUP24590.1 hypothetical protein AWJ19_19895 [Paenibacillus sp. DMB5]
MNSIIYRCRYVGILILLILSFKLLSVTQTGPGWEVPTFVFDEIRKIQNKMIILFLVEIVLIIYDAVKKNKPGTLSLLLYIPAVLFSFIIYSYGSEQVIFNLQGDAPILSAIVSNSLFIGVPVACLLAGTLTYLGWKQHLEYRTGDQYERG